MQCWSLIWFLFYVSSNSNPFTSSHIISIPHKIHIITHCSQLFVVFIIIFLFYFVIKLNCLVFKWFSIDTLAIQHGSAVDLRLTLQFSHCFEIFEYFPLCRMEPKKKQKIDKLFCPRCWPHTTELQMNWCWTVFWMLIQLKDCYYQNPFFLFWLNKQHQINQHSSHSP